MKLTKTKLKQIIKEELGNVIQERGMTLMTHGNCEDLYDQYITAKQGGYTEEQMSLKNQLDKAGCIKMDEELTKAQEKRKEKLEDELDDLQHQ